MAALVLDQLLARRLLEERRASGADRFDEVWEGTYVMAPRADDEHQEIQARLVTVFQLILEWGAKGLVRAGVNVSDREEDWQFNYRCPDVVVFLSASSARNCGTQWLGGPDFAVEILSAGDRALQKLPFYASVNVRELLVIDRDPWAIELYRLHGSELASVGRSTSAEPQTLESDLLPLTFRLLPASAGGRPAIKVRHRHNDQRWTI
jgi:Uma2 family endonuclease